ncbi:MAG: cupin domain-containing protein [Planctomycetes bacterium]|nr:cupin domain-containing protein [Planctomycetota bacterium]MBL7008876.1 cupin domain-containing protein [Planctomycetota bacterium]
MEAYETLDWSQTSVPGLRLVSLDRQPDGSAWVLIELAPGAAYPAHRHRGPEEVFVVRGSYRDAAGEYRPGSLQRFAAGTSHAPVAGPAGSLLYARSECGIEILGRGGAGEGFPGGG